MANYGPHQYLCSPQGSSPVKIKHTSISRVLQGPGPSGAHRPVARAAGHCRVGPGPAVRRPSIRSGSSATGASPRKPSWRASLPIPAIPTIPISIERDFNSLWNTGYFDDLRIEREDTEKGIILNVFVREKPTIREINYKGLNAVSQSDVLDRFKKEKVGLSVESQYDPTKIKRAETVLKDMLSEHGHQFATIKTEVKTIPPASVQVNFNIKEGPTVKVGQIKFTGNQHLSGLLLRRSMKNLKPIGIPYSIIFENLFAADLRRLQARGRHRAGAPGLPRQGLLQRRDRRAQDADSRRRRPELVHLPAQQGQAHRHPHAH